MNSSPNLKKQWFIVNFKFVDFPMTVEEEERLFQQCYKDFLIPTNPVPQEINFKELLEEIKQNKMPSWILEDHGLIKDFMAAHQKYVAKLRTKTENDILARNLPSTSGNTPNFSKGQLEGEINAGEVDGHNSGLTYKAFQFPGKKGIRDVLVYRIPKDEDSCYTFSHRRTNKSKIAIYTCIACKNHPFNKLELKVVDGRFMTDPAQLPHACTPVSYRHECFKRKCYQAVRNLRHGNEEGLTPREAYARVMKETQKEGAILGADESSAIYSRKRASFSRAVNSHKKKKTAPEAAQESHSEDKEIFVIEKNIEKSQELVPPKSETDASFQLSESQEILPLDKAQGNSVAEDRKYFPIGFPIGSNSPDEIQRLYEQVEQLQRENLELLREKEEDRREIEELKRERDQLKELSDERKRHIDTLYHLMPKSH